MSAVPSPALEKTPQRDFPRHPINVPLDLIALRSGVPENLPGRCTDISEAGVGAVVAGELSPGQQVAVELRLPNVGVPVRTRALVRYQSRLRCGLEFFGLSVEQREMIRYWVFRSAPVEFSRNRLKDKKETEHGRSSKTVETPLLPGSWCCRMRRDTHRPPRNLRAARLHVRARRGMVAVAEVLERIGNTGGAESRLRVSPKPWRSES